MTSRSIFTRVIAFFLTVLLLAGMPEQTVFASDVAENAEKVANEILSQGNTRRHAYVACLYDDNSMSYITTVLTGSSEMERSRVTQLYGLGGDVYSMTGSSLVSDGVEGGNGKVTLTRGGVSATPIQKVEDIPSNSINGIAPLSFPFTLRNSSDADINRAYAVANGMGNDLMGALLFINNGHSYSDIGNHSYLMEMRYYLLSFMTASKGSGSIVNSYGYKYDIAYDVPKQGQVTITQKGYYQKLIVGTTTDTSNHYTYRAEDKWDASSFRALPQLKQKSKVFTYKVKKGYKKGTPEFEDGVKNNLIGQYANDIEYLNWAHLVLEAELLYAEGIAYDNYGDLFTKSVTESVITDTFGNFLSNIQAKLDLYPISDLIFNDGIFGSDAYIYGVFPAEWFPNMQMFFLIMSVVALSVIIISVLSQIGRAGLSANGRVGARYALMQSFWDSLVSTLGIAFFIPLCLILFYLSSLITDIFRGIAAMSPRGIDGLFPGNNYGTLAGIVLAFAKLIICGYINILYILRMIMLVGLFCFAPIFIVAFGFGKKGQQIMGSWLSELIGNLLIQPIHAGVFALLMSVSVGLRTIEALTMVACIIPLTNFYRGLITKGGSLAGNLAGKITGGAAAAATGAAAAGVGLVGGAVGLGFNAAGNPVGGAVATGLTAATQGIGTGIAGAGTALALGSETGHGEQMMSSGIRQTGNAVPRDVQNNRSKEVEYENPESSAGAPPDSAVPPAGNSMPAPYGGSVQTSSSGGSEVSGRMRDGFLNSDTISGSHMFGDSGYAEDAGFTPFDYGNQYMSDGDLVSEHTSAFGQFDNLSLSEDGSLFKGQISLEPEMATAEQKANFDCLRTAYNSILDTCEANGVTGQQRADVINSRMSEFGFSSFSMPNAKGDTASVTFANSIGAKGAAATDDGRAAFAFDVG